MNTKGKNRSVQRTQALLKDGLTELMQTKPVQNITVRELTDYVNLNRGTFYLHYRDIQDLLEHLEMIYWMNLSKSPTPTSHRI